MKFIYGFILVCLSFNAIAQSTFIEDDSRDRQIPVKFYPPASPASCSVEEKCPVAFLSAGYGMQHTDYGFVANALSQLGYFTVAIRHEMPEDPPLSVSGNLYQTRTENWIRGAKSLEVVRAKLSDRFRHLNFKELLLVGHSNGGDISSWLGNKGHTYVKSIITLDHRRVPLPRSAEIKILSIRAGDFPADRGVLPSAAEQQKYASCIIKIEDARHNDMWDGGPDPLKQDILAIVRHHLRGEDCCYLAGL